MQLPEKSIKYFLSALCLINISLLIFCYLQGGFNKGLFYYMLIDSPELSHLSDLSISLLNVITTFIYIMAIALPLSILFLKVLARYMTVATCIALIPLLHILIRLYIFPAPDYFGQHEENGYILRIYSWHSGINKTNKIWRSAKPAAFYKYGERVKWIRQAPANN